MDRVPGRERIDELPQRQDLDSFPCPERKHLPITCNDDTGTRGRRAFEDSIVRLVGKQTHASHGRHDLSHGRQKERRPRKLFGSSGKLARKNPENLLKDRPRKRELERALPVSYTHLTLPTKA